MNEVGKTKHHTEKNLQKKEKEFWIDKLGPNFKKTIIPHGNSISGIGKIDKSYKFYLTDIISDQIRSLSNDSDPRILVVLTSSLAVLLSELNQNMEQVVLGMPVYSANKDFTPINNVVPVILNLGEASNFKALLNHVKNSMKEGLENDVYPIASIPVLIKAEEKKNASFSIFDIAVCFDGIQNKKHLEDFDYKVLFYFKKSGKKISVNIEYNSAIYSESSIKELQENFLVITSNLLIDINKDISNIHLINDKQKKKILSEFNKTQTLYNKRTSIAQLFEKQVEKTPHRVAVVINDRNITYEVLNQKSNALANTLKKRGVENGTLIGLMIERSIEMIIGILGVLKAGGGYLAIDNSIPRNRFKHIIKDSGINLFIGSSDNILTFEEDIEKLDIEDAIKGTDDASYGKDITSNNKIAYVLYTSGTTGFPKGVVTEESNVIAYCNAFLDEFSLQVNDIILQQASHSFDTFVEEIFPMLFSGGKIVIADKDKVTNITDLADYIIKNAISIVDCTPLIIRKLGEEVRERSNIQSVISGGDILKGEYLNEFPEHVSCYNTYGPTESTVCATYYDCNKRIKGDVPIGKPISNYKVLILNKNLKLVPNGWIGEICIAGKGVARGYLNKVELTDEKFISNPYNKEERLYKSGDLGKYDNNGIISFCGRTDNQISLRGFRIELEEVRNQILRHRDVINAIVVPLEKNDDKWICAYIVSDKFISENSMKDFLLNSLPYYMVPSFIIRIDEIPIDRNGKISTETLPDPFFMNTGNLVYINNKMLMSAKENIREPNKKSQQSQFTGTESCELSHNEKEKLLNDFNKTYHDYDNGKHLIDLFEEQVERTPHRIAVVFNDSNLTYYQINIYARNLVFELVKRGVRSNTIVGLLVERSINMMIGILAVLKAGGAFMPLEEEVPDQKIAYIISNVRPQIVLVDQQNASRKIDVRVLNLSKFNYSLAPGAVLNIPKSPNDITHVLHTSGTTGSPKSVLINNSSIINLFNYVNDLIKFEETDNVLSLTPVTFDVFSAETLLPLIKGSKVHIADTGVSLNSIYIADLIQKESISFLQFSPTGLQRLISNNEIKNSLKYVKNIISAGESLLDSIKEKLSKLTNAKLFNLYGPTETTLYSTGKDVSGSNSLTIGYPVYNTEVRILDQKRRLVPIESEGEIYIAGAGVARGYINEPEMTHEAFINIDKKRFYKTGDLAKWLNGGQIDFLGRIDHQVQLGGVRVELGEIENAILQYGNMNEVAVIIKEDSDNVKYLVAFLVADKIINETEIREYLTKNLPLYLMPRNFVQLESMPYTSSRKIHRKLLESLELPSGTQKNTIVPKTPTQKKILDTWSEVLNIPENEICINDNFFAIGGHSLKALICIEKLNKSAKAEISLIDIFQNSTISQLADLIDTKSRKPKVIDDNLLLLKEGEVNGQNIFLIHDGSGEVDGYIEFCLQADDKINYWGIRAKNLKKIAPTNFSIEQLAKKYIKLLKSEQSNGAYNIIGWSLGGTIAYEMARQLEQESQNINFLGIIDSVPPNKAKSVKLEEFTMESELIWIKKYLDEDILARLDSETNLEDFWTNLVGYLKNIDEASEIIKREIIKNIGFEINEYKKVSIEELVKYMNFARSLSSACKTYVPKNSIDTRISYFAACKSKSIIKQGWEQFSTRHIDIREVQGDHFSILKGPNVESLYRQLKECYNQVVKNELLEA